MARRLKKSVFGARVYADAAAATPLSSSARKELLRLLDVYGNAGALHREAIAAKNELEQARTTIAQSIGAHPDEIIFTASGTEGNNMAIQGVVRPLMRQHCSLHAITSAIEHQSVLEPLYALGAEGLEVTEMPVDREGLVAPAALAETIRENTVFISIQLVNSEVGTIEPIRAIAKEIRHARTIRSERKPSSPLPIYIHTDASQAPYWVRIQVAHMGIDLLTLDGQKVQGPKGIGALYIRRGVGVESVMRGGVQEFGLRAGTPNVPLAGSFAVALREAQEHIEKRIARVNGVRDYLWKEIRAAIPGIITNGPAFEHRVANNLNISIPGLDGETATIALNALGIAVSTRSACNTGAQEPSHVIRALGTTPMLAHTAIRVTLLPSATKADARKIAAALKRVCELYRK